jgi:hypothetical protein
MSKTEYNRAYREANKEQESARKRAWYQAHKERLRAKQQEYYWANLERIREQQREYRARKKAAVHRVEPDIRVIIQSEEAAKRARVAALRAENAQRVREAGYGA